MKSKICCSFILSTLFILVLPSVSRNQPIQWQQTNLVDGNPIGYLQSNSYGDIFASRVGDFNGTIYRTTDMGDTWTLQTNGLALGWQHLLAVNSNDIIFAAGEMEISYSTDNGDTWLPTAPILASPVVLGIDYNDDIYFSGNIIEGGDIYKSTDNGNSWILINSGLENYWVNDIAFSPDGYVFVATFETQPNNYGKIFYSSNHGASWLPFNMNFIPVPDNIVVNANGYIFVSSYVHYVYRSTDFGASWELVNDNLSDIVEMKINQIGHIFISANGQGIYRSTNNGNSWEPVNSGLTNLHTGSLCIDPTGFLYTGLGALPGSIYRTTASSIPVELISFTALVRENDVTLNWITATETNNYGFEIERKTENDSYVKVGYVPGQGTTTEISEYNFIDSEVRPGIYKYRLKQIDYDGQYEYSKSVEVNMGIPDKFELSQNFPNPFNPQTVIEYSISKTSNVRVVIFNITGEIITELINEEQSAGRYTLTWDGKDNKGKMVTSGIYIYQMMAGDFIGSKKMIFAK